MPEATIQHPEPESGSDVSSALERIETILSTLASAISCMQDGQSPRKLADRARAIGQFGYGSGRQTEDDAGSVALNNYG